MRPDHFTAAALVATLALATRLPAQEQPVPPPPPTASIVTPAPPPSVATATVSATARRGLSGRLAAILVSGQQGGNLQLSGFAFPATSAGPSDRIPFVLDVSGASLSQVVTQASFSLELYVYAMRDQGDVVGYDTSDLRVEGFAPAALVVSGLKVLGSVQTSQVPKALRIMVREPVSAAFALIEVPVPQLSERGSAPSGPVVMDPEYGAMSPVGPGPMRGNMQLSALIVSDPANAWLTVTVGGVTKGGAEAPFTLADADAVPSTRPVIRPGRTQRVTLLGRWLPPDPQIGARIEFDSGLPAQSCLARLIRRLPAPAGQFERLDVSVSVPDLAPGEYHLLMWCGAAGSANETSVGTRFRVPAPDKVAQNLVWPGVPVADNERVGLPVAGLGGQRSSEEAPPHLKAAYRQALAKATTAGPAAARSDLAALERAALPRGTPSEFGSLAAAENAVAKQLVKVNPEAVLGLALLHLDLYREYSRQLAYLPLAHERRIVEEMAVLLAEKGKRDDLKKAAADVLAVFAGDLQEAGSRATSERLFFRALAFDPKNGAALMGRAGIFERASQPGPAIDQLEKMLAAHPDSAEARLRLGVNLNRARRTGQARKTLNLCTSESNPEWVRSIAWQQLAQFAIDGGDLQEAVRLLQVATKAIPSDPHLRVLLASCYDRLGKHRDARITMRSALAGQADAGPSARFHYAEWPHDDLIAARARLAARETGSLAALATALEQGSDS